MATLDELLFGAKLEAWRHKMFHVFHFLQCAMVLGILNTLKWIFNTISNEKSCLISMPFLSTYIDVRTVKYFPPAESWLANSNFPRARRMQGEICRILHILGKPNSIIALLFIQNISSFFKEFRHYITLFVFPLTKYNTTLSPGFLGQRFNNLQRAALLTSSVQ